MPISATGTADPSAGSFGARPARARAGFTLVELMVVMVIVGLAAAAVALTLPPQGSDLRKEAERLAARLGQAQQMAVVGGETIGFDLTAEGYTFLRWRGGQWQPLPTAEPGRLDPETRIIVTREGSRLTGPVPGSAEAAAAGRDAGARDGSVGGTDEDPVPTGPVPELWFEEVGLSAPFVLTLTRGRDTYVIRGDGTGGIDLETSDEGA